MDMGVFNQDMYKNSYSQKPSGSGQKKEKKRGIIDMISAAQMRYAAEKNGVPLPADVITTGHIWDYSADIMETGLIDILITFLFVAVGIIFLIASGNFYNFHSFFFLNYVIGGFVFAIPGSYYSLMLTSTIARFYEKNLTNTAKIIRLIFNSLISIQILKFFIINVAFFAIFEVLKKQVWLYRFCDSKIKYAIQIRNKNMYFLYRNILNTLTDKNYKTITEIAIDLTVGLVFILVPPIIAMVYKSKKTKNIKNTNIIRGQAVEDMTNTKSKESYITHDYKFDNRGVGIFGSNGTGKSALLNYLIEKRMLEKMPQKWVFVDITGEYMAQFYRQGDVIIDVTDRRCAEWNFLEDIGNLFAIKELSHDIVPVSGDEKNRFFSDAARLAIYDALIECWNNYRLDNLSLKKQLIYQAKPYFERIVEITGGASQSFTDVYQTYRNFIDPFLYLNTEGKTAFKLTEWLKNEKDGRRLFLNMHEDSLQTQGRILNLFFVFFANKILSQNFKPAGRINVVVDEFANLNVISNLPRTLSLCRKKDVAFFLATQSAKELYRIYGERFYNLMDNLNNKYVFRANDGETARLLSEMFGRIEKKELMTNTAVSAAFKQEHTTTYSTTIRETNLVLSGDIKSLPDYNYFGSIVSEDGIRTIKVNAKNRNYAGAKTVNSAGTLYLPSNIDYHAQIKALEDEILKDAKAEADQKKKEKEQKEQKLSKKDIKNTLKKVKEMAEVATEEDKEDDNDANNQHS